MDEKVTTRRIKAKVLARNDCGSIFEGEFIKFCWEVYMMLSERSARDPARSLKSAICFDAVQKRTQFNKA